METMKQLSKCFYDINCDDIFIWFKAQGFEQRSTHYYLNTYNKTRDSKLIEELNSTNLGNW